MSTTVVPPFNATEYIKKQNEKERPPAAGAAPVVPATTDTKPAADTADSGDAGGDHKGRDSRSQRRLLRRLGEAEGRAKTLEELLAKGVTPAGTAQPAAAVDPDPEPARDKFANDADYHKALGAWSARQETKKTIAEGQTIDQFKGQLQAASTKAAADVKLIEGWDEAQAEMAEDDRFDFEPAKQPTLMSLLALSDVQAEMYYHFAKNPAEWEKLLAMSPADQIKTFHRLEGRVEGKYAKAAADTKDEKKDEKKPTNEARDAKKAKPSESVRVVGGSAPTTKVSPYLEDGKTVNPAWLAERNERDRRR